MIRLLRRASPVALLLAFLMQATAMAATVEVAISDFQFTPSIINVRMGDTVHWTNNGPSPHTATSNAPLSLWDSGVLSDGDDFSFQFTAAGTYLYFCQLHPTMQGRVRPKPVATPRNGDVGTVFTIRVASIPAPTGFVYDVQKKNPGGPWQNWMIRITSNSALFDSTGQPTGIYQFRSRLHRLSDNAASGYSQAANITVTSVPPAELFFSEYVEGSINNKALEIFNGTGSAVDLLAGDYDVQFYFNGSFFAGTTIVLTGVVAAGDVYVLADDSAHPDILAQADQVSTSTFFNGNDAVVLRKAGTIVDAIGQIGFDPPADEWGSGLTSTQDNTLRRKVTVEAGDPNASDPFDPAIEWDGFAQDTFGGLGNRVLLASRTAAPVEMRSGLFPAGTLGATASVQHLGMDRV